MRQAGPLGVAERSDSNKTSISSAVILFLLFCLTSFTVACGTAAGAGSSNGTSASQPAATGQLKLSSLPTDASVGVAYNAVASVSGGTAPYLFSVSVGSLPPGLALNSSTGSISGVPSAAGTYTFTLNVSTVAGTDSISPSSPKMSPLVEKESGSIATHIVVSASGPRLSISPANPTLTSQAQQQFTASLSGTASTAVTWSASAGSISGSGLFVAPKVTANTSVSVTATSAANSATRASVALTVTPPTALAIETASLPGADSGIPYTAALSATGGTAPYQWSITSGALPAGIQLQASSGVITGIASSAGSYPFSAKVLDSAGHSASQAFTLAVSSGSANGFDGPAELPRVYIQSAMANTPAPGATTSVNAGGDLQSALNNASCGDTIQLQAGATFTGIFTFPAKSCDANHWIIVRTSAEDSALPAEGSRLTPCYAGVSSLPGRPALQCAATKNVVTKLVTAAAGNGPIVFAAGANHYRLTGLEITRLAGTGLIYALASTQSSGAANNIIFDRVWLHGTAQDDTTRGIDLGSGTYFSIVDSFFTDFHCVSLTGSCTDSQTIYGGLGNETTGPYKIVDNFLEASGENILLGGGSATITPADIEISRNHIFKPLTWMKGEAGFVGGKNGNPFIVKNLLELKNAQRVLIDSNLMEDSWGGFSQVGFAILLTPKNQAGSDGANLCPACQVTDVTIRYTSMSHVAAGLQIANALAGTGAPLDGQRYSIHDIVVDDIDGAKYDGPGDFAQISVSAGAPILQNVTINHITAFPPSTMLMIGDMAATSGRMKNFVFTNGIANTGAFPVWSTGGGSTNCAFDDQPLSAFNACFSPYSFAGNALIGSPSGYPPSLWPSGNFFPANATAVEFMNYSGGNGGNYQLQSSSPYKGAGTDGLDLGADIVALDAALAGVE
jgi:hypothetical protein